MTGRSWGTSIFGTFGPLGAFATVSGLLFAAASHPVWAAGPPKPPVTRTAPPPASTRFPATSPAGAPQAFLIYLIDGGDPIVVKRYIEDGDQIRFEKYGGWIGIPRYEVSKIVPDTPDPAANLPPVPGPDATAAAGGADTLYVTTRDGAAVKATAVKPEGDRLRISIPEGSFTLPRSDVVGIVRVPASPQSPEAWLTVLATELAGAVDAGTDPGGPDQSTPRSPATSPAPPLLLRSDQPHLLRLANGQSLRVEGFWVEGSEIRFRRFGGMVGMALNEVARLIPERLAPVSGRTPVRYAHQVGPDLLEVRVKSGPQRVRLIGVEPVEGTRTDENPWQSLSRGLVVYLEFDRQRYDPQGAWLAYVFMPNGRMLNAELIRLGLARPRPDARNLRYLDLFQEVKPGSDQVVDSEPK